MTGKRGDIMMFISIMIVIVGALLVLSVKAGFIKSIAKTSDKMFGTEFTSDFEEEPQTIEGGTYSQVGSYTDEEQKAVDALNSIFKDVTKCRDSYKGKKGCICDMNVPEYDSKFVMQFENYPMPGKFLGIIFKGVKTDPLPRTGQYLLKKEFTSLQLCTSKDLLANDPRANPVHPETKFNVYRDDKAKLRFYDVVNERWDSIHPIYFMQHLDEFKQEDKMKYVIYRADDSHVCFIVSREGEEGYDNSYYTNRKREDYATTIDNLPRC